MEPQVNINCMRTRDICCCLRMVIVLFAILLAFFVGVFIGGITGLLGFIGIGAFIVLIILLAVILIGLLIFFRCRGCRRRC